MIGESNCIGFYTEEVRNDFDRIGFDCVSLEGKRQRIADVDFKSNVRSSRVFFMCKKSFLYNIMHIMLYFNLQVC